LIYYYLLKHKNKSKSLSKIIKQDPIKKQLIQALNNKIVLQIDNIITLLPIIQTVITVISIIWVYIKDNKIILNGHNKLESQDHIKIIKIKYKK
jgi:hypothetical protein